MALFFCSFASGSSGNCYMVRSNTTSLLIDVGITGKRIIEGLDRNHLKPADIDGILITHEHIDHVKSIRMLSRKSENAKIIASEGTIERIKDKIDKSAADRIVTIPEGCSSFLVGDINVNPFRLSHDAVEPMGYSFEKDGKRITIVTDTGYVSEDIFEQISDADLLVLEANHEVNILKMGPYPYSLKQRILGEEGHLSNETAGKCICRMLKKVNRRKVPKVVLAHLSKENNTPEQAYLTIRNILMEEDYYIDRDLQLEVIERDEISSLMRI